MANPKRNICLEKGLAEYATAVARLNDLTLDEFVTALVEMAVEKARVHMHGRPSISITPGPGPRPPSPPDDIIPEPAPVRMQYPEEPPKVDDGGEEEAHRAAVRAGGKAQAQAIIAAEEARRRAAKA